MTKDMAFQQQNVPRWVPTWSLATELLRADGMGRIRLQKAMHIWTGPAGNQESH